MSELQTVQLDAIGVGILAPVVDQDGNVVDISGATTKTISLKDPDKIVSVKAGSFVTDGTDGKLIYVTVSGDLNKVGIWEAQADIVKNGFDIPTVVTRFKVLRNIVC